jgi:hypothetical protein
VTYTENNIDSLERVTDTENNIDSLERVTDTENNRPRGLDTDYTID